MNKNSWIKVLLLLLLAAPVFASTDLTSSMSYYSQGPAKAGEISLCDQITPGTYFKIGSASGQGITTIKYSNNGGRNWDYVPQGAVVDPAVTNIKWIGANLSTGQMITVQYKTQAAKSL